MAYGELLRQRVLDLPPQGCLNLHASLLPRWRGASPLQAALRAGDAETGVSVMRMVRALDAGPVYHRERLSLAGRPTLPWLHDAIAALAATALARTLDRWGSLTADPQDEAEVTTCRKLLPEDGRLVWSDTRQELERWVRAYTPAPGCWACPADRGAERIRILAIDPRDAGTVDQGRTRIVDGELQVGCGDGWAAITRLQSPGRKPMDGPAWLNGNRAPARFA
jgi:methionyl-tRNA formyltransferase